MSCYIYFTSSPTISTVNAEMVVRLWTQNRHAPLGLFPPTSPAPVSCSAVPSHAPAVTGQ